MQTTLESKRRLAKLHDATAGTQHHGSNSADFVTLRVRPSRQPGRATHSRNMYSPPTQEEDDEVCTQAVKLGGLLVEGILRRNGHIISIDEGVNSIFMGQLCHRYG